MTLVAKTESVDDFTLMRFWRWIGNPWLQLALNAVIVTISELFLKMGARATAHPTESWAWTGITGLASAWTWLAIIFIILSLLTWLYVLRHLRSQSRFRFPTLLTFWCRWSAGSSW